MPLIPASPNGAPAPPAAGQPVLPQPPRLPQREPPLGLRANRPASMSFTAQAQQNPVGQTHSHVLQSFPQSPGTVVIAPPVCYLPYPSFSADSFQPHLGTVSPTMATFIISHYEGLTGGRVYGHYSLPPGVDLRVYFIFLQFFRLADGWQTFLHIVAHEAGDSGRTFSFRHTRIHEPVTSVNNPLARVPAVYRHDFLERVWGIGWKYIYIYRLASDETGHTHYDLVLSQGVIRPREDEGGNTSALATRQFTAATHGGRGGVFSAHRGGHVSARGGGSRDSTAHAGGDTRTAAGGVAGGVPSVGMSNAGGPSVARPTTVTNAEAPPLAFLQRSATQDSSGHGVDPPNPSEEAVDNDDNSVKEGEII